MEPTRADRGYGRRILVVEDEATIAMLLAKGIAAAGCQLVGPAFQLRTALQFVKERSFDAAFLDVSLPDGNVYPIAEQLLVRGTPFVFTTGYDDDGLLPKWRGRPNLNKPFTMAELQERIEFLCHEFSKGSSHLGQAG